MAASHFTGPLISGPILNTSGTTLGQDVADVGYVVLTQKAAATQSATAASTSIVIPANSAIISITLLVSVAWSGTSTISVGTSATATELVGATTASAVGVLDLTPGTTKAKLDLWANTGTSDVQIYILSGAPGSPAGSGTLLVTYAQAING
jgi:hypothetical protein